ncbi:MAG: glycosyltransferase family A protein [Candidatus Binatia bacterium]
MLVFVIPLKSRRASRSWDYVNRLFERCLKSVCNQTSPAFRVIVVCHEKPTIEFTHPAVTYASVDFPEPDSHHHPSLNQDKYRKRARGFIIARPFMPSHVMQVDADDCVSNRLAEFVARNLQTHGWFLDSGYFYRDGGRRIYLKEQGFHHWCGTSHIIRHDLLKLPENEDLDDSDLASLSPARMRKSLLPLPFPGAVYVNSRHGEGNRSRRNLFSDLRQHPRVFLSRAKKQFDQLFRSETLTETLAAEFGLYTLPASTKSEIVDPSPQNLSSAKKQQ